MPEVPFNEQNQLVFSLLCIVSLILSGIIYSRVENSRGSVPENNSTNTTFTSGTNIEINILENNTVVIKKPLIKKIVQQPSCPPKDKTKEIEDICDDLLKRRYSCSPEDVSNPLKHKIPKYYYHSVKNNSSNETQNAVVNCIIAALLLTSLGAAILEFYRAKFSPHPPEDRKHSKTPFNRKCSLADLTVLKHHRKELVRRESIIEHPEEKGKWDDDFGSQARHQGSKPFPLDRRCSFPVSLPSDEGQPLGSPFLQRRNSRKISMATDINRRVSIVTEGGVRKLSMVTDDDVLRRGSLIGDVDSSPEKKHHSRLVHRH